MTKTGRPKKEIDWDMLERVCEMSPTLEQVAHVFKCSPDTIERAINTRTKGTFAEFCDNLYKKDLEIVKVRKEINWEAFDGLCGIMCTTEEIANFFKCSESTIRRIVKEQKKMTFKQYFNKKSANGLISIRRFQFHLAKTNATMAIFLGKQYLGQKDKLDYDVNNKIIDATFEELKHLSELEIDKQIGEKIKLLTYKATE